MPIRQYDCADCGKSHDVIVRTIEDYPIRCPHCASEKISQAVTAMGGIKGNFGTVYKKNAGSYKRGK
jgi:putative FmdB family regulatory protein